jgi:hypothetical protein
MRSLFQGYIYTAVNIRDLLLYKIGVIYPKKPVRHFRCQKKKVFSGASDAASKLQKAMERERCNYYGGTGVDYSRNRKLVNRGE